MEALLASFTMVSVAELGDKTQLLSFYLATRFRARPWPVISGILAATLVNHFVAAAVGDWVAANVGEDIMRTVVGSVFLAFALWGLVPDKFDADSQKPGALGPFVTTLVAFFIAEMGDKTQLATVALGAKFASLWMVVIGTTLGMMAANVPAVLLGDRLTKYIPLDKMRFLAAALFAGFGIITLMGADFGLSMLIERGAPGSDH